MKKTISITLALIGVLFNTSCRQDNESILEPSEEKTILNKTVTSKIGDSTVTSNSTEFGDIIIDEGGEGDPPPKKGGQWKVQN